MSIETAETIEVSTAFMKDAVQVVVPYLPRSRNDKSNAFEHHPYSRTFLAALADEIEANDPTCDHSVGICACEENRVLAELRLLLDGKRTCATCHGDGFIDAGYEDGPEHEFRNCPECEGRGWVSAPEEHNNPITCKPDDVDESAGLRDGLGVVETLRGQTLPCSGRPGWRFDPDTGEQWYSTAWLDIH